MIMSDYQGLLLVISIIVIAFVVSRVFSFVYLWFQKKKKIKKELEFEKTLLHDMITNEEELYQEIIQITDNMNNKSPTETSKRLTNVFLGWSRAHYTIEITLILIPIDMN